MGILKEIDYASAGRQTDKLLNRVLQTNPMSEELLRKVEDHMRKRIRHGFYTKFICYPESRLT